MYISVCLYIFVCIWGECMAISHSHKTKITKKSFWSPFFKFVLHHFVFFFAVKAEKVNGDIAPGSDKAS